MIRAGPALRWALFLAWCAGIFLLSSREELPEVMPRFPGQDKVSHGIAYGAGGFLFASASRATWAGLSGPSAVLLAGAAGLLYGGSDEFHQSFVPNRTPDLLDLLADGAGALLGGAVHAWLFKTGRRSRNSGIAR
jgi:VanZ family protein